MRALERKDDVDAAAAAWRRGFRDGAEVIATVESNAVFWHDRFEIWGLFGKTRGRGGIRRDWNAFGQKPSSFRSNTTVEINQPPHGIDPNLQAVFVLDGRGKRWLMHQGRMSVRPKNVTEADFIAATGLKPVGVEFSDGSRAAYHIVAPLDEPSVVLQEHMAAFIAQCAKARLAKKAPPDTVIAALAKAQDWERGLSPEATGTFEIAAQDAKQGRRRHAEVWRALAAELTRRSIPHSNDRVGQYGPDLFTYGTAAPVLFEIKSGATAADIFGGVGQLHIYELLLRHSYRKVLVIPKGMGNALKAPLGSLDVHVVEYERVGGKVMLNGGALDTCLKC